MKFRVKNIPLKLLSSSVMMNPEDAKELGLIPGDRLRVKYGSRFCIKDLHIAMEMLERGEVGFCKTTGLCDIKVTEGTEVDVLPVPKPNSVEYIRKKLNGAKLTREEIYSIIQDIVVDMLNESEITAFVTSSYTRGMDMDEIEWMTRAMIDTGDSLTFEKGVVVDKHSIGGVPGNKISLLVIPIIASSGLLIPKTASRAITSASGTADTMEVLADVNLNIEEIKEITERVGGVIAWGGATNIAPADDKIIKVERPLSIDPLPQLLASVMAKKGSIGAKHVIIDIPVGEGSKIANNEKGRELANNFSELGRRLGLNVSCVITYGEQPVGRTIGPALEAIEGLKALEKPEFPESLIEKAVGVAGALLELAGVTDSGPSYARKILTSGRALKKFKEIVGAQGGDTDITAEDIPVGDKTFELKAQTNGTITKIYNSKLVKIARTAGAPKDKGAGIILYKKVGQHIKANDTILKIFSEKEWKLEYAIETLKEGIPFVISNMIIERYPSHKSFIS